MPPLRLVLLAAIAVAGHASLRVPEGSKAQWMRASGSLRADGPVDGAAWRNQTAEARVSQQGPAGEGASGDGEAAGGSMDSERTHSSGWAAAAGKPKASKPVAPARATLAGPQEAAVVSFIPATVEKPKALEPAAPVQATVARPQEMVARSQASAAYRGSRNRTVTLPANRTDAAGIARFHLEAAAQRRVVGGCGRNEVVVAPGLHQRIQQQFLASHVDYICECLTANYEQSIYKPDDTLTASGPGFEKVFSVPLGQEKQMLCKAMEYLAAFVPDTVCMEGSQLVHNDNWKTALC